MKTNSVADIAPSAFRQYTMDIFNIPRVCISMSRTFSAAWEGESYKLFIASNERNAVGRRLSCYMLTYLITHTRLFVSEQ